MEIVDGVDGVDEFSSEEGSVGRFALMIMSLMTLHPDSESVSDTFEESSS